jgi:hypothetical protein
MRVHSSHEYTTSLFVFSPDGESAEDKRKEFSSTFDEYIDLVKRDPNTKYLCPENKIQDELRSLFTVPTALLWTSEGDYETDEDRVPMFQFVGNAGNVSSMHFDGDISCLLHYQVFGRKRHIIAHLARR